MQYYKKFDSLNCKTLCQCKKGIKFLQNFYKKKLYDYLLTIFYVNLSGRGVEILVENLELDCSNKTVTFNNSLFSFL